MRLFSRLGLLCASVASVGLFGMANAANLYGGVNVGFDNAWLNESDYVEGFSRAAYAYREWNFLGQHTGSSEATVTPGNMELNAYLGSSGGKPEAISSMAFGSLSDVITIDHPDYTGQFGFLFGTVSTVGSSFFASVQFGGNKMIYESGQHNFVGIFQFGTPIGSTLSMDTRCRIEAMDSGTCSAPATLQWGGIDLITLEDGSTVTDFSYQSESGFNWLQPVPEPRTYMLMLAGLAMIGAIARRRIQTTLA